MCWCIEEQLVHQQISKTSSCLAGHHEHPYTSLGASRHNLCNNRHPDASRIILIIHINTLVHQGKMYASMELQVFQLLWGTSWTSIDIQAIQLCQEHPYNSQWCFKTQLVHNQHPRHPAAIRVILSIHINPLVHQGTTCASIYIQDIQLNRESSWSSLCFSWCIHVIMNTLYQPYREPYAVDFW